METVKKLANKALILIVLGAVIAVGAALNAETVVKVACSLESVLGAEKPSPACVAAE